MIYSQSSNNEDHRDSPLWDSRVSGHSVARERLNRRVGRIVRRAFGFHSAEATLALVMLSGGPVTITLPW